MIWRDDVFLTDVGADVGILFDVSVGSERGGPGDVAMTSGVELVAALAENPAGALKGFAQGEKIGGDVLVLLRETLLSGGELVHERKAEVMFFGGEVDGGEFAAATVGGVPTDVSAEAGGVTGGLKIADVAEEFEEDGFEEVPVFGATGEESAKPEVVGFDFVDVEDGEVALAGGCDVEAETSDECRVSSVGGRRPHP